MPEGVTVCVNCGASADAEPDVDNSAAISRMLEGKEDNIESADNSTVVVESDELTDEQEEAFNSGKQIEFSGGTSSGGLTGGLSEEALESISAMNEMELDDILPPPEPVVLHPPSEEPEKPEEPEVQSSPEYLELFGDHDDILIQKGVTELHKISIPQHIRNCVFLALCLIVMFVIGFGFHFMLIRGAFDSHINEVSLYSVRAVQMRTAPGEEFMAVDIYVKKDADITECIVFGVLSTGANDYTPTHYRFLISNHDMSDTTMIRPFDRAEYDRLVQGSGEERVRAATMLGLHDNFLRSVEEINAGNMRWQKADMGFIKTRLSRY